MAVNPEAAFNWINSPPSRPKRLYYAWLRFYHHILPHWVDGRLSWSNFFSKLLHFASIVGIVSAPFWIAVFSEHKLPLKTAAFFSLLILIFRLFGWIAPKIRKLGQGSADRRQHLDELATRQFNIIKEILGSLPNDALPDNSQWKLRVIERTLFCAIHLAKNTIKGAAHQQLHCTLLAFEGDNGGLVKILARARDSRPSGESVQATETIAYYVSAVGKFFVVNDINSQNVFPKRGLSSPRLRYRSILLIPIITHSENAKLCAGVIAVDSPRPCEFWGDIGDSLATQLMPFVFVLSTLMKSGYKQIRVQEQ